MFAFQQSFFKTCREVVFSGRSNCRISGHAQVAESVCILLQKSVEVQVRFATHAPFNRFQIFHKVAAGPNFGGLNVLSGLSTHLALNDASAITPSLYEGLSFGMISLSYLNCFPKVRIRIGPRRSRNITCPTIQFQVTASGANLP